MARYRIDSECSKQIRNLETALAQVRTDRAKLEVRESVIRELIAGYWKLMELESGGATPAPVHEVEVPAHAFAGMRIIEAVCAYLEMAKTGRTFAEIVAGLRQGNLQTTSKFFKDNVRTALRRQATRAGLIRINDLWWVRDWPQTPSLAEEAVVKPLVEARRSSTDEDAAAPSNEGVPATIVGAMERVMRAGGPNVSLTPSEVFRRVRDLGFSTTRDSISATLRKDRLFRFVRVGPGAYRLATPAEQKHAKSNAKPRTRVRAGARHLGDQVR